VLVRTFAQQLLHAAGANYFFTNMALGQKPPAEEDPKRDQYKTKADVVAFLKKSFADGAAAISSKGDAGMAGTVTDPEATDSSAFPTWRMRLSSTPGSTTINWPSTTV
jgi:hypothetical protein